MSEHPEWPVAFFDDDYLRIYRPTFTAERTATEVAFIESLLGAPGGAALLDLACGYGRHAIGMAGLGYRVTGLDFNPQYLAIAEAEAKAAGATVAWRTGDMRALPFEREFDGAYSFFTSFGYFGDDENEQVLAGVARALRPGGRFLLDMMNRDWLLTHPEQRTWTQREDGSLFMEETILDLASSRVVARQRLIDGRGGSQVTKEYFLRAYTCAELTSLLRRHGLLVKEVCGGTDRRAYDTEAHRLVLVSERSA
ncbi:MAG: class I SAM-dependent methyltransferase [Candidatus Eisenbacteria bacterium]|nr:class I SAM-dependent methyltransferase [Candidatus Eisenbacteria bacterium]